MAGECTSLTYVFHTSAQQFQETNLYSPVAVSADDIFRALEADLDCGSGELTAMAPLGGRGCGLNPLMSCKSSSFDALQEVVEAPKSKRQKLIVVEDGGGYSDGQQKVSHITVERNRRKQMNEHLTVLRSLMPCFYVKRGDQASIIEGVVDYITELQQILQALEAKKQRKVYSEVLSPRIISSPRTLSLSPQKPPLSPMSTLPISPRTPQPASLYGSRLSLPSSPANSFTTSDMSVNELVANSRSAMAEVEVKFAGGNLLLKTWSNRLPGQTTKVIAVLEKLSLEVLQAKISIVDETMVNSFTIKIGVECQLSAQELAQHIQQTFC
ncbi:hypothetical protein L1887_23367 [Cichorium endivia]|nr:hypothetical protein L1887_23367 [Cichorium endivia]